VGARSYRNAPRSSAYSLERMEEELLAPANLRFVRDENGQISDVSSTNARKEGALAIEAVTPDAYTPELLYAALDAAERSEREFMRTGVRQMTGGENGTMSNIDFERAVILSNLLDDASLSMLSARGMHGKATGDRMAKVDAVADLLYKGSYNRDLYTNASTMGLAKDQGHLESNKSGGTRLRPEVALVNQWLQATEGKDRLKAINQARLRMNAAKTFSPEVLNDPSIGRLTQYKDFQNMIDKQAKRKSEYGFN